MRNKRSEMRCSTSTRSNPARRWRALLIGVCGLFGACTGLFQRAMPDTPASYLRLAMGEELVVGAAERDITPAVGGYMSGFDLARTSVSVASPLKVRAMVLGIGGRRFAIIGVDNLGMLRGDVDWIKGGLEGFANGDVFICASHTHSGPDLIGLWGWYLWTSGRSPDYLRALGEATAEAVAEAWSNAAPARMVSGQERIPSTGWFKNPNRSGVFDRRMVVVHARAIDDDRPLGTLLHAACHPEVLPRRNRMLSADFVGSLCDGWREQGLGQAVFVNGALGSMVSPQVKDRNMAGVEWLGGEMLELGMSALEQAQPLPVDSIEVRRQDVYMPLNSIGLQLGRLTAAIPSEVYDGRVRTTVGWLRIGALQAICVPGEMEPALAERIRGRLHQPDLLVFGLCDDELGYLMREQDARDPLFAYERSMSPCLRAGELIEAALCGPNQ